MLYNTDLTVNSEENVVRKLVGQHFQHLLYLLCEINKRHFEILEESPNLQVLRLFF